MASVFNFFDGLVRNDRIRYDSPIWEGFQFATSAIDGGAFDLAGRFAREYDDFRIAAAIGLVAATSFNRAQPSAYGYAGYRRERVELASPARMPLQGRRPRPMSPPIAASRPMVRSRCSLKTVLISRSRAACAIRITTIPPEPRYPRI